MGITCTKNPFRPFNPSDPDVFSYTYPRRGGVITPPLVKSLFSKENHVFCSCGEI